MVIGNSAVKVGGRGVALVLSEGGQREWNWGTCVILSKKCPKKPTSSAFSCEANADTLAEMGMLSAWVLQ